MDKMTLRIELKRKRKENLAFSSSLSSIITQKILSHPKYIASKKVGIYISLEGEVNTRELILHSLKDKKVCVPKVIDDHMIMTRIQTLDELHPGFFNILEPDGNSDEEDLDLIIVPMLGFDSSNHRIGFGKGYYDQYLSHHKNVYKLGIAFEYQKVDSVFSTTLDVPLDEIITEAS